MHKPDCRCSVGDKFGLAWAEGNMDQDNVLSSRTVLLPVDVQEGFFQPDAPRLGAWDFEPKGLALLSAWRRNGWPILHIRHDSVEPASRLRPDRAGNSFRPGFAPHAGEPLIAKSVNSAFLGTDLDLRLKRLGADGVWRLNLSWHAGVGHARGVLP